MLVHLISEICEDVSRFWSKLFEFSLSFLKNGIFLHYLMLSGQNRLKCLKLLMGLGLDSYSSPRNFSIEEVKMVLLLLLLFITMVIIVIKSRVQTFFSYEKRNCLLPSLEKSAEVCVPEIYLNSQTNCSVLHAV